MVTIKRFSIHRTALTLACVMALSSVLFLIPMSLMFFTTMMTDAQGLSVRPSMPGVMLFIMPFFYLIVSYLMTALGAFIYNLVARVTGGIQFELSEAGEP